MTSSPIFGNNLKPIITQDVSINDVTVTVDLNSIVNAPTPDGVNTYLSLTFQDNLTGLIDEIVQCTSIDFEHGVLTITRAQEGTTALAWPAVSSSLSAYVTAGDLGAVGSGASPITSAAMSTWLNTLPPEPQVDTPGWWSNGGVPTFS